MWLSFEFYLSCAKTACCGNVHFFAGGALIAKINFFACFAPGHASLCDWRAAVLAVVASAHVAADFDAFAATEAQWPCGSSSALFTLENLVLVVLFARRAVLSPRLGHFHRLEGRGTI